MKPLNLFTPRRFKSSFHLTIKHISFVFISIIVLFVALPAFAQKDKKVDNIDNKVLEERIKGFEKEFVLRNEKTEQRIDAVKEALVLKDDKIEQRINIYLAVVLAIFAIVGFLGYKTIVKWIQQRIEDKTGKEVKKYIEKKGETVVEPLLVKFKEELNRIESTRIEYEKRLDRLPKDIDLNKPMPEVTRKDLKKFVEKLPEAKTEKTYSHNDWFYKGLEEYERKEYSDAINSWIKAIELNSKEALYYHVRGIAYGELEDYKKAIEDFNKAIELNPKDALYYDNRGGAYAELEDHKKAIEDYNKAIELDPKDALYYNNRGVAYVEFKDYRKAIEDYNKAIELDPKDALYYNNRGVAYLKREEYKKAIEDYNKAIELDPKDISSYQNLSEAFILVGSFKDALDSITKALDLAVEPSHKAIYFYLECIAKKLLKLDTSVSEAKFNEVLQKEFALIWSIEPIESWLKEIDISNDDKDYILRLTQLLKTKKT
ncbi:MAG: tetratricopeptide repeat protein [Thermodesulfobacteriota bacterium]